MSWRGAGFYYVLDAPLPPPREEWQREGVQFDILPRGNGNEGACNLLCLNTWSDVMVEVMKSGAEGGGVVCLHHWIISTGFHNKICTLFRCRNFDFSVGTVFHSDFDNIEHFEYPVFLFSTLWLYWRYIEITDIYSKYHQPTYYHRLSEYQ